MSETVNAHQASALAGVTPHTIKYWILSGWLPAEKVGSRWVIRISDLERVNNERKDSNYRWTRGPLRRKKPSRQRTAL